MKPIKRDRMKPIKRDHMKPIKTALLLVALVLLVTGVWAVFGAVWWGRTSISEGAIGLGVCGVFGVVLVFLVINLDRWTEVEVELPGRYEGEADGADREG